MIANPTAARAVLFISLVTSYLLGPMGQAQSIEQAVRLMLYNEPEIQAANYDRLSAEEDYKVVRGDLRPQVTLNGSAGYIQRDRSVDGLVTSSGDALFSRQLGVSIRQLVYDGGLVRQQTLAAKKGYQLQELVERSMVEARVVDLIETYMEVLRAQAQVKIAREQVGRHQQMRDKLKARVGNKGNRADVALVDGRLSLAVNSLDTQKLAYENALIRFVRLTGQPVHGVAYPSVPNLPGEESAVDLSGNWDYLAATMALEAAEHRYRSSKGNNKPKIYVDAGASRGQDVLGVDGQDDEVRALLVMSWDLYRGGANKAEQKREHWQVRKAEELVNAAREQAAYLLALLWKERQGSISSVSSLENYVQRLEGVLSDYQEQFEVGRQELLNILDVQSELYSAQTQLTDARFNVDTTVYRMLGIQGALTDHVITEEEMRSYLDRNPDREGTPSDLIRLQEQGVVQASQNSAPRITEVQPASSAPQPSTIQAKRRGIRLPDPRRIFDR